MKDIRQTIGIGGLLVRISIDNCYEDNRIDNRYYSNTSIISHRSYIHIEDNRITVKNDWCGLFRVYYWRDGNEIFLTDNIYSFLSQAQIEALETLNGEYEYFRHHGYTSGAATYYKKIKKVAPGETLSIDENGISKKEGNTGIFNQKNIPNHYRYRYSVYNHIETTLRELLKTDDKIILCYSGGTDSHYLASIMNHLGLGFELVYFYSDKLQPVRSGLKKARKGASRLRKTLHVLNTDHHRDDIDKAIKERMIFDSHIAYLHFYGTGKIVEKWGNNIVIVNGQNADSIFSFGPSEQKPTSWMKRYLMYGHNSALKYFFAKIIGKAFGKKLDVPRSIKECAAAFYANFKYCMLLNRSDDKELSYVTATVDNIIKRHEFTGINGLLMFIKANTHIQGSDSQVVIQSANHFRVKVLMPFSSDEIIKNTLRYKSDSKELKHPKYLLRNK